MNLINLDDKHPKNRYFMADAGYDSKKIRHTILDMNYKPLIVQNKRNIKDPDKIIKFNKREEIIYKKRLVIERIINRMKMNRKICLRYESKIENFMGFVYLSLIKMLC